MLNGVDPIIIFNFKILPPSIQASIAKIPIVESIIGAIDLPLVPIYLSEKLTGIYIDTESKNIEIDTQTETLSSGGDPTFHQRGIQSTVRIDMLANQDSLGVALFSAMADFIFPRVTSKEYSITYLHGAVTVFAGLLHSFSMNQDASSTLYKISMELIKPSKGIKSAIPVVSKVTGAVPL
jgi:hypothetical protein